MLQAKSLSSFYATDIRRDGYLVCEGVLSDRGVDELRSAMAAIPSGEQVRRKQNIYGIRNLLEVSPAVCELASRSSIRQFVTPVLGERAFAVRATYFDKVPGANWSLFWHQDNMIAVRERLDVQGFVGWSQKAGVWQVQPPVEVLANMLAVRIHLDDCGADNGPLRVIPGSHRHGWLDDQMGDWCRRPAVCCTVGCGGVVVMSPLILHASAPAEVVGHRRVIHIEYAAADLPGGLQWNRRIGGHLSVNEAADS